MRECGLSNTRDVLNKQVSPGEESHQRLFDDLALAFDDGLNGFNQETDFFLCLNLWQSTSLRLILEVTARAFGAG